MAKLKKKDMIALVAEAKGGTKKDAEASLDAVLTAIVTALSNGDDVALSGFGNFEIRERNERQGVNPQLITELIEQGVSKEDARAQAAITIPATRTVVATLSPKVKDVVK